MMTVAENAVLRRHLARFAAFVLICAAPMSGMSGVAAGRDPDKRVKAFLEAYLRRPLTGAETAQIAAGSTEKESDLAALPPVTDILINKDGQAEALMVRHQIIQGTYFSGATSPVDPKIFQELDLVLVVDRQHKRLMTERDVVAIANIANFGLSQADPSHKDLPRETVMRLTAALDKAYGPYKNAGELPPLFSEAAAFWAGVRREWPRLNASEREFVRKYCQATWGATPHKAATNELYARLWGLSKEQAAMRSLDDTMRATRAVSMASMGVYARFDMMKLVTAEAGRW